MAATLRLTRQTRGIELWRGRYSSQPRPFAATGGETITLRCHGAAGWPNLIASLIAPDLAVIVKPDED